MWKVRNLVMLPTEDKTKIRFWENQGDLTAKLIDYHLYIISDEEIKKGDWFIGNSMGAKLEEIRICNHIKNDVYYQDLDEGFGIAKKIIATSDEGMNIELPNGDYEFPQIPESFIKQFLEKYNKGNVIEKVEVEYKRQKTCKPPYCVDLCDSCEKEILKLRYNTISIKEFEEKMYSREEVIQAFVAGFKNCESLHEKAFSIQEEAIKWIKEKL